MVRGTGGVATCWRLAQHERETVAAMSDSYKIPAFDDLASAVEATEGWFPRESAAVWDCLLRQQSAARLAGNLMEIGVWHGRSAIMLAAHARLDQDRVVLADHYPRRQEIAAALKRVSRSESEKINVLQADSQTLIYHPNLQKAARTYRWIHIDGEHTATALMADLAVANVLLGNYGIVAIDDIFNAWYPQLSDALFRYLAAHPDHFTLFMLAYGKAYLTRHRGGTGYRRYVRGRLPEDMLDRGFATTLVKTTDVSEMDCYSVVSQFDGRRIRGPDWDPDRIEVTDTFSLGNTDGGAHN